MDKELLAIMACPKCKKNLKLNKNSLVCSACKLEFSVDNNVPNMLISEARKIR